MTSIRIDRKQVGALSLNGASLRPNDVLKYVTIHEPNDLESIAAFQTLKRSLVDHVMQKEKAAPDAGATPINGWLAAVPVSLRHDLEKAVEYLCMLVAIDFRHWGEGSATEATVGEVVVQKNFYAVACDATAPHMEAHPDETGASSTPPPATLVRGSAAMVLLMREAVDRLHVSWYDTHYLLSPESGSDAALERIFWGVEADGTTPMLMPAAVDRIKLLREIAAAKRERASGTFLQMLRDRGNYYLFSDNLVGQISSPNGAEAAMASRHHEGFMDQLLDLHRRYDDSATLRAHSGPHQNQEVKIYFLKLPQLTAIALHTAFPDDIVFRDYASLSVCSDYQLPKALRTSGLIEYHLHLANLVDHRRLVAVGSQEEVELRVASTIAAQHLMDYVNASEPLTNSPCSCDVGDVDYVLWFLGRSDTSQPHHLCRTMMY